MMSKPLVFNYCNFQLKVSFFVTNGIPSKRIIIHFMKTDSLKPYRQHLIVEETCRRTSFKAFLIVLIDSVIFSSRNITYFVQHFPADTK